MDWPQAIERFGLPTFLVLAVGFAVWRVGQYLGKRLFNGNGLIPQLVRIHADFVDSVKKSLDAQTKMLASIERKISASDRNRIIIADIGERLESGLVSLGAEPDPEFSDRMRIKRG